MKYLIEISEEQADALRDACEICARIGMYQLHDICRMLPMASPYEMEKYREIYSKLWDMYLHYTRTMHQYKKPEQTNILWDLYQVIRQRIANDTHPEGNKYGTVDFDNPLKTAKCELAKIRRADEPVQEVERAECANVGGIRKSKRIARRKAKNNK